MQIKKRHLVYAAQNTAWVGGGLTLAVVFIAIVTRAGLPDLVYGLAFVAAITAAVFGYWLWRTQRETPHAAAHGHGSKRHGHKARH